MTLSSILPDEININGVIYARKNPAATHLKFWFMYDCHLFTELKGDTLQEILADADRIERSPDGAYGALCPVVVMAGDKELRRVGVMVHARGSHDLKNAWEAGKKIWLEQVSQDPDVIRLLNSTKNQ